MDMCYIMHKHLLKIKISVFDFQFVGLPAVFCQPGQLCCVWKMRAVISTMISFTPDDPIFRLARPQRVQGSVSEVAQPLHLHNL